MTINWLHWISSSFVSWFTEPKSEISPPTILTSGDHAPFIFDCLIQVDLQIYIFHMVWSEYLRAPAQIGCFRNVSKPHLLGRSPSPSIPDPVYHFSTAWPSQSAPYVWDFLSSSQLQAQELGMIPFFLALDTWLRIRRLRLHGVTRLGGIELHVKRLFRSILPNFWNIGFLWILH